MKSKEESPKSEVRSPKSEIRGARPQATTPGDGTGFASDEDGSASTFWIWGDEPEKEMVLHDEPPRSGNGSQDLEERAARFGEAIIRFARKLPHNPVTNRLIDQLVGAGTSIGANYAEAKDAVSRKDFKNKVGISRKESKETMFFLRMIATAYEESAPEARTLWREAKELNLIFGAIWRK